MFGAPELVVASAVVGFIAGLMIGCIGIGGVIIVPVLMYLAGVPIKIAIAAAMMGYAVSGLVALAVYLHELREDRAADEAEVALSSAGWLWAGAMPAALAGAWAVNVLPGGILEFVIGTLIIVSAVRELLFSGQGQVESPRLGAGPMVLFGAITGFGSALTGTGGPIILSPLLLWQRQAILRVIRLGQTVQFPIATLATIGNFLYGTPDVALGVIIAVSLAAGTFAGARIGKRMPVATLRFLVSISLMAVGGLMVIKVFQGTFGLAG